MCGIVAYVGPRDCQEFLVRGLKRLEYRGYDSSGIATLSREGVIERRRMEGKLAGLRSLLEATPVGGTMGIGHTRWATHGEPSTSNAHPHQVGAVAVVHNGIIENYQRLRSELIADGATFTSETDSEVIAHMVDQRIRDGAHFREAVIQTCQRLEGSYGFVVIDERYPDRLVAARMSSPLVVGFGEGEHMVASDVTAILEHTRDVAFVPDGQGVEVFGDAVVGFDLQSGRTLELERRRIDWCLERAQKGGFAHYMLKEIHEQSRAVADTLRGRLDVELRCVTLEDRLTQERVKAASTVHIVACGTSRHAGLVAARWFETWAGCTPHVSVASEFRYRDVPLVPTDVVIGISQSGETADTLEALRLAAAAGATTIGVTNVMESSVARLCDSVLYTQAGPEISVASTKAFTTQLAVLFMLAIRWGRLNGFLRQEREASGVEQLLALPHALERLLGFETDYRGLAEEWSHVNSMMFIGRGTLAPIALEGALKLKEISYIHAEGCPAGELKHGPLALIDRSVPTVVLAPRSRHFPKVLSNAKEIEARGGPVVWVHTEGEPVPDWVAASVPLPDVPEASLPVVSVVALQLLSYHVACERGSDVDQPRNLAKSVTVE